MLWTQAKFRESPIYIGLSAGKYTLSYHDNTHLEVDKWEPLLEIYLQRAPKGGTFGDAEPYYTLRRLPPVISTGPREIQVIDDTVSLSLARLGLLSPTLSADLYNEVVKLSEMDGVVLVPDTNALYNGGLRWLLRIFRHSQVWILPFVVSLTQIQMRDASLKGMVNRRRATNLSQALRSRALINASLGLLERYKARYQVVELDPSLLRYVRAAGRGGADQDEGDVLEDRLLIEGIHAIFRSMRTRAEQRVVTSDVLLGRILHAEGIPTLFLPTPKLGNRTIPCLTYEPIAKAFCGSTLASTIWDLAQSFSSVRLSVGKSVRLELGAYWPEKTSEDWLNERLIDSHSGAAPTSRTAAVANRTRGSDLPAREDDGHVPPRRARVLPGSRDEPLSDAVLPQASLPYIFRLAGALLGGPAPIPELLARLSETERSTVGTARRALEILRRIGLMTVDGEVVRPMGMVSELDRELKAGHLDPISSAFEKFVPYKIAMDLLRDRSRLTPEDFEREVRTELGAPPAKEAAARFIRFPVLLGQAWTDQTVVRDGSRRPTSTEALAGWYNAFKRTARDGAARVSDVLLSVCRDLRVSPWTASQQLAALVSDGQLRELSFQPAAGGKPVARDQVVSGGLSNPVLVAVPTDRIIIAGRPVFSVSGDLS